MKVSGQGFRPEALLVSGVGNRCKHRPALMHNRLDCLRALVRGDDLRNRRGHSQLRASADQPKGVAGVATKGGFKEYEPRR